MEEKIKISISQNVLNLLKKDCIDFKIVKENGSPNFNAFINTLIVNFYETFSSNEESLVADVKKAISIIPDYYKDGVFQNVIKILTKKIDDDGEKTKTTTFSFKPTKISEKAIIHIEHVILKNESISSFYRRLFNAYARKTKNEREKIIHKENYELLLKAIKQKVKVCAQLTTGQVLTNVLGYDNKNNVTARLAKIKSVTLLAETAVIPKENVELLDRQIACAPQYPMYKSDNKPITVELTEKGKQLFEKIYLYRPTPVKIEGNVYTFNCSATQVLYYFERFGNNALITSPKKLGIDMQNYHYFALKKYSQFYKLQK